MREAVASHLGKRKAHFFGMANLHKRRSRAVAPADLCPDWPLRGPALAMDRGRQSSSHYNFARRAMPLLQQSRATPSLIAWPRPPVTGEMPFAFAHASTVWAIVGLVKSLAIELRPLGIGVRSILQQQPSNAAFCGAIDVEDAAALASLSTRRPPKMSPRK